MRPSFNTAGPCFPGEHYMLPPERRLDRVRELMKDGKYFTLHAGRQTGKTTCAQWVVSHYNAGERLRALWVDLETAQGKPDPASAFRTVLTKLDMAVEMSLPGLGLPPDRARLLDDPDTAVLRYLRHLATRSPGPLVVLVDEAESLCGEALVSFLTQIRDGYLARRLRPFPHSVALIGTRAARDYALTEEEGRPLAWLGASSPFNISAEAATLSAFTPADVVELCAQHTTATGQRFEADAAARIFERSQGQPWLVNALADHVVDRELRDRSQPVTLAHVDAAGEAIVLDRRSPVGSLASILAEPRVRRILDAMLVGDRVTGEALDGDFAYASGLGLIRPRQGQFEIANPIYREVIPRALTYIQQMQIAEDPEAFVRPDGGLDMPGLMAAWQSFWRRDGHLAAESFGYREAGPHLMLMAFVQRVVDGGGRVEREYGLGRGVLDLTIAWREARHTIAVKVRRNAEAEADALEHVGRRLDAAGLDEGWLVLFELRSTLPWSDRLTSRTVEARGKRVHVIGC